MENYVIQFDVTIVFNCFSRWSAEMENCVIQYDVTIVFNCFSGSVAQTIRGTNLDFPEVRLGLTVFGNKVWEKY